MILSFVNRSLFNIINVFCSSIKPKVSRQEFCKPKALNITKVGVISKNKKVDPNLVSWLSRMVDLVYQVSGGRMLGLIRMVLSIFMAGK